MVAEGMSAELALKYVQMKHPPAWPNDGFRYQLKLFEGVPHACCSCPVPDLSIAGTTCWTQWGQLYCQNSRKLCLQIWAASWIPTTSPTSASC